MSICEISTTEISPMQTEQRRLTRTVFSCKRACPTCEIPPHQDEGIPLLTNLLTRGKLVPLLGMWVEATSAEGEAETTSAMVMKPARTFTAEYPSIEVKRPSMLRCGNAEK
jgi:hypothetical protein